MTIQFVHLFHLYSTSNSTQFRALYKKWRTLSSHSTPLQITVILIFYKAFSLVKIEKMWISDCLVHKRSNDYIVCFKKIKV